MDTLEAIRHRRSIRKYIDKPVEDEKIQKILEAGRWAPSASNKQPWHFIVIRDANMRKTLADNHSYGRFMSQSPVVIIVLGDPEKHPKYHLADPHNAVQNMLLAAYAEGLGTCWMGVRDTGIEPKFKQLLDIPEKYRVVCSISVGYHEMDATRGRVDLEDIVSYEKYGGKQ